ncbi:hypothetical protein ACLB2K_027461 [Fragaria x ananassa]
MILQICTHDENICDGWHAGTVWSACAHIITTAIGVGVLSLAWAMAQLGWVAGSLLFLFISATSLFTATVLEDCYRSPDPETGRRNYTYMEVVKSYLGGTMYKFCGFILYTDLVAVSVGYSITAAKSMLAIQKSICRQRSGGASSCRFSNIPHGLGFGIVQVVLSQIPNFHKLAWLSKLAALMSFGYASIAIGLSIEKIISGPEGKTSLTGLHQAPSEKVWSIFTAAGDIALSYVFTVTVIEIQDTLKSSPPENKVMKKATKIGVMVMTILFIFCGTLGYAAFGDEKVPENLMAGFLSQKSFWIVDLANVFVVVHLVGAFQVFSQPVYRLIEVWATRRWPKSGFVTKETAVGFGRAKFDVNMLRLCCRTGFVLLTTVIATALPFFSDMLALLGAIGFWPLTIYFPLQLHIAQKKIQRASLRWFGLQLLSVVCFLISVAAACGAVHGVHKGLKVNRPFQFKE